MEHIIAVSIGGVIGIILIFVHHWFVNGRKF